MDLPASNRAFVEPAKLHGYLLSPEHPGGRFKAKFFRALGYAASDWTALRDDLVILARTGTATEGDKTTFGQKYVVRGTLTGPVGRRAAIVTVWIILRDEDFPRFITAYPEQS